MKNTVSAMTGCILVILTLSFVPGCSTKYLRLKEPPPHNPGVILPIEVKVEMKAGYAERKVVRTGRGRKTSTAKKLSGELIGWDNGVLTIQGKREHKIRTDNIKRLEIGSSEGQNMGFGCLAGIGASAAIWVLIILII